jgi:arylsulfatase A-like enzyme
MRSFSPVVLVCLACLAPASTPAAERPPNVLVVILDDVGVDSLAVYGEAGACSTSGARCFSDTDCPGAQTCAEDYPATPTIDRLAAEGVLFRNAWAAPTCKPSRAAGITGRYGLRTGVLSNGDRFPAADERTIAEALRDPTIVPTAYATAAFGKWGLGVNISPNDGGFDRFAGHLGAAIGEDYFHWDRTVDGVTATCSPGSTACPDASYATTVNVDDALEWLDGKAGPWFVWFSFNAPHSPWQVPPHELVSPAMLARLPTGEDGSTAPPGTVCLGAARRTCYLAMLEALDTELDRLLDEVPPDTWVILLGDNGTPLQVTRDPFPSDHAKGTVYEGGINVPLIVRSPERASAGAETAAFVHVVDLFATSIGIAGGRVPLDRRVDSLSLVPLVHGPDLALRPRAYAEGEDGQAARDERFKLIRRVAADELYDLEGDPPAVESDPFEQNDLLAGTLTEAQQAAYDVLGAEIEGAASPAGRVPDGEVVPGIPLRLGKASGDRIALSWGASCEVEDTNYGIYEGTLGDFRSHAPRLCGTAGVPAATITPEEGDRYYLVAPSNGLREGSYGAASSGLPRPPSSSACFPYSHAGCE